MYLLCVSYAFFFLHKKHVEVIFFLLLIIFNFQVVSQVDLENCRLPFLYSLFPDVKQRSAHAKYD